MTATALDGKERRGRRPRVRVLGTHCRGPIAADGSRLITAFPVGAARATRLPRPPGGIPGGQLPFPGIIDT